MSSSFGGPSSVRNKISLDVISLLSDNSDDDMEVNRSMNTYKPPDAPRSTNTAEVELSIIKIEPPSSASPSNSEAQDQSTTTSDTSQTGSSNMSTHEVTSSASSEDDLPIKDVLKKGRKCGAKEPPRRPYIEVPCGPLQTSSGCIFADQVMRSMDFFSPGHSPFAQIQELVDSVSSPSRKRKRCYDNPKDSLLLHGTEVDQMVKEKDKRMAVYLARSREETDGKRHRSATSRTHKPKPSTPVPQTAKDPTPKSGQGQTSGLSRTAIGGGGQSCASHAPARARAQSQDPVKLPKNKSTRWEQLLNPVPNAQSSTVVPHTILTRSSGEQIPDELERQLATNRDKDDRSRDESLSLFMSPKTLPSTASAKRPTETHVASRPLHAPTPVRNHTARKTSTNSRAGSGSRFHRTDRQPEARKRGSAAQQTHGTIGGSSRPDAIVLDGDEDNGLKEYIGSGHDRRPDRQPEYTELNMVTSDSKMRQLRRQAAAQKADGKRNAQQSQPLIRNIGAGEKSQFRNPEKASFSKEVRDPVNTQRLLAAVNNAQFVRKATSGLEPAPATDSRPTYNGQRSGLSQPHLATSNVVGDPYESTPEADPQVVFSSSSPPSQPATRKCHAPDWPQRSIKPNGLQPFRHLGRKPQSAAHRRMNGADADEDNEDDEDEDDDGELDSSSLQGQLLSAPATQWSDRPGSQSTFTQFAPPVLSKKPTPPSSEELLAEMQMNNRRVAHGPRHTRIVDPSSIASTGLVGPVLPEVSHAELQSIKAQARTSKEENDSSELAKLVRLIQGRRKRIPKELRKNHPGKTQEFYDQEFKTKFEAYIENKKKAYTGDQERFNAALLTAGFHEHAQDDEEPLNAQVVFQTASSNTKGIPAYKAIGERTMAQWVVRVSEPYSESAAPHVKFCGTKEFLKKCEASKYAWNMLHFSTPPINSKQSEKRTEYDDIRMKTDADGLFLFGKKRYSTGEASGKWVQIFIEENKALASDYPGVLRDKFVDEEIVHRNAAFQLQVTLVKSYPKASKEAIRKQDHELPPEQAHVAAHEIQASTEEPAVEEDDDPQGLDGDGVRQVFAMGPPGLGKNFQIHDDEEEDSSSETSSQDSEDSIQAHGNEIDHDESDAIDSKPLVNFTEQSLRLANEHALEVATKEWKPRIPHYCAQAHYEDDVLPYLTAQHKRVDKEKLVLEFPKYRGKFDHRIWGFRRSIVRVDRLELKGPVDYAIPYSRNANDVYRPELVQAAAEEEEHEASQIAKLAALRSIPGLEKKSSRAAQGVDDADSEEDSDGLEEEEDEDLSEED